MKLIIINGLPATGKTTLAKPLSKGLGIPVIAKDTIKEFLFDELGVKDRAWSGTLGKVSSFFLYELTEIMLAEGQSIIVENAFETILARPRLQEIITNHKPTVLELYCMTEPEIRKHRFVSRNEAGLRHKGHADHENYAANADQEPYEKYAPLKLGTVMQIDTNKEVDIEKIIDAINLQT